MPQYDTRLYVCQSVTLIVFHTGWNTLKIISRLIYALYDLRFMLGLTPTWAIWYSKIRVE